MGATRASYGLGHVPGRGRTPTEAYITVPELFDYLYSVLMVNDYHPKCFKEATGIILKKS
jgi:hypothetical protein